MNLSRDDQIEQLKQIRTARGPRPVPDDSVYAQLKALAAGPAARWRRFRLLEVVCRRCGGPLAEVMATTPGPVLVARNPGLSYSRGGSAHRITRDRDVRFLVADGGRTDVGCDCQRVTLLHSELAEMIAAKTRRHVLP